MEEIQKKQTPLEWLIDKVNADCLNSTFIRPDLIQQALEMEKSIIEKSYNSGRFDERSEKISRYYHRTAELFYKETFTKYE